MFNCIATNITNECNSLIHAEKKRKGGKAKCSDERKILKLTSGTSTLKTIEMSQNDCGECRFCKDMKKIGGNRTLKKRCERKEKAPKI